MTKWFRRSEHEHAINTGRRACRRGDLDAAERWLKYAEHYLAHSMRHDKAIHEMMMRDEERHRARAETARQSAPSELDLFERLDKFVSSPEPDDVDF